ncbi:hypothetical protein Pelo_4034 [Pelomyxa schiedti]|nr:hypothetical protein Pelo_4034 [Pelomyxa schiedti]
MISALASTLGSSKQCENAFENSANSSSVRNPPKREYLSAEMIGCLPMQTVMVAGIELLGDRGRSRIDCFEAAKRYNKQVPLGATARIAGKITSRWSKTIFQV